MSRAFLSLGSNMGDRIEYLRSAVDALGQESLLEVRGISKVYETEPVEVPEDQPDYLNCVVEVEYDASAIELLRFCQGVEAALGRVRKGKRAPRTLDIDILLFEEEVIDSPSLIVPHRGILRTFNLRGLADLAPGLYIPGYGFVRDLLADAGPGGIREFGEVR